MSLKAWKFFKKFFRECDSSESLPDGFNYFIPMPTADDFTIYTKPLETDRSFDFVAHIRICGTNTIRSQDLTHLASLNSLGILEIIEPSEPKLPFPHLSDGLVRMWSEQKDPFPSLKILRVLSLWLTGQSLSYVSSFNQLCLFEATGRQADWQTGKTLARELGWVYCNPHDAKKSYLRRNDNLSQGRPWNYSSGDTMLLPLTGYIDICRQDFGSGGNFGRLNWIYWLFDSLYRTPLRIDERQTRQLLSMLNSEETFYAMELERPIATLSLGKEAVANETVPHTTGSHPFHQKAYFWRYWLPDGESTLQARSDVSLEPRANFTRHPQPQPPSPKEPLKKPVKDMTTARRKRRRGERVDHLREFLGDDGRGSSAKKNHQ